MIVSVTIPIVYHFDSTTTNPPDTVCSGHIRFRSVQAGLRHFMGCAGVVQRKVCKRQGVEVQAYIQAARYERSAQRKDHRNGRYTRSLGTAMGELEDLRVPRTRKGFRTNYSSATKGGTPNWMTVFATCSSMASAPKKLGGR